NVNSPAGEAGRFISQSSSGTILRGFGGGSQRMVLDGLGNMTITGTLTASSISGTVSNATQLNGAPASVYARNDGGNTFAGPQTISSSFGGPMLTVVQNGSGNGMDVQAASGNAIQGSTSGAAGVVGSGIGAGGIGVMGITSGTGTAGRFQAAPSGTLITGFNGSTVFKVEGDGNVTAASFTGDGSGLTGITSASATNAT